MSQLALESQPQTRLQAERLQSRVPETGSAGGRWYGLSGSLVLEGGWRLCRKDAVAGASALLLVVMAAVVGGLLYLAGRPVQASAAPFYAHWLPHVGPGTPLAVAVAALVIWKGPLFAARMSWRSLLPAGYLAAVTWTLGLALVDGWKTGLATRLTTTPEYLHEVPGVTDVALAIRTFAGRILDFQPDSWTTHVAGHPPGALLIFVWLDRIGLGGGGWAALVCVLVGALAAIAVPETLRLMGDADAGRVAVPFAVLFPGAIWIGASADGLFAGVAAVGIMLLAKGQRRWAVVGGGLLAFAVYLSYGLVLLAPIVLVVLVQRRAWWSMGVAALSGAVVVAAFTASGFWWLDGYHLVVERYYQGLASVRPYGYWVWANLAALVGSGGPALAAVLRRGVPEIVTRWRAVRHVVVQRGLRLAVPGRAPRTAAARRVKIRQAWLQRSQLGGAQMQQAQVRRGGPKQTATIPLSQRPGPQPASATLSKARSARTRHPPVATWLLPLAAASAILLADISGLSKAETERIWLPFAVWFTAGAALLPAQGRRSWLAIQAATALIINHLLLTSW
ncbi:hypothetical protein AB0368_34245 [Actinoplanes sp. NPDC051475]|uniref:hypothetical protein n=1 Tax=Actinoplanes sp. NPDC051475 TaxID=3157225 RepID=UPI00344E252C